jgi:hypothetical protein
MAIYENERDREPAGWELALAKRWVKIAHRLMEDPEVARMVTDIVAKFRPATTTFYPWVQPHTSSPSPWLQSPNTCEYTATGGSDA